MKNDGRCTYYKAGNREKMENRGKKLAEGVGEYSKVGKVGNREKIVKRRDRSIEGKRRRSKRLTFAMYREC